MITGKNKGDFEDWLNKVDWFEDTELFSSHYTNMDFFSDLKVEMQIGVYLAYYDSTKYKITINYNSVADWYFKIKENKILKSSGGNFKTRNEAYKEAFKQADKLINNQK